MTGIALKQIKEAPQIARTDRPQAWAKQQYNVLVTLTPAANLAWDLGQSNAFKIVLTQNVTLVPQNMQPGAFYTLVVKQDAIGGRTLTLSGAFVWPDALPPTPSLDPNAKDIYTFFYDGEAFLGCQQTKFA